MNKEKEYLKQISELQMKVKELELKENNFKKVEKELNSVNQLLSETGSMAKVGGWEIDLKTGKVIWSDETKKIHEVEADYLPSVEQAIEFFYGESKSIITTAVDKAIKKGIGYDLELEIITKNGNIKNVHSIGSPLFKNGKCIRLNGTFQDITQRKKLEQTIIKTRDFLNETEKIGRIGGWQFNPLTLKQTWSDEIFRILEYDNFDQTPEVPKGIEFIDPEFRLEASKAIEEAVTKGKEYDFVWKVNTVKGNSKWVRSLGKCEIENGKVVNVHGSFQDITEQRIAEEELKSLNQQLKANEQQLRASNEQIRASEQQLRAANQQLEASDQLLRSINYELIASQEQIVKSKERSESYLNIVAEIVLSLNTKANITLINDSGAEFLGLPKADIIGKNWFENFVPSESRANTENDFLKLISGQLKGLKFYESVIINAKGEQKTILWHNSLLRDKDGNIEGVLSSGEDLTKRKKAENDLKTLNNKLLLAQNIAKIGYWSLNISTQMPSWSDEVFNMYGIPKANGELNYPEQKKVVHPDDWEYFDNSVQKLINEEIPYDVQIRIFKPDGNLVWIRTRGYISDNKQELFGIAQDITDFKIYEIELEEQQELLEKIFNTITDGIIITDKNRIIKFINKGLCELTGFKEKELLGRSTKVIYESKDTFKEIGELIDSNSFEVLRNFYVKPYKRKNGEVFPGETFVSKLFDNEGNWTGNLGVIRDVSERIRFIDELNKAKEKAIVSEEKYKALYENAPLSYQSLDEDGRFLDVNPTWLSTLGYEREEVVGNYYKDFLHPQWKEHFEINFPKFKSKGHVHDVGFKIRHKDGHYIDISFEGCIGYHPDGSFKQTYCVFQDVTEKNLAVEKLLKNQYYLSKAQEIGKIGTWELDLTENKLVWTEETYNIYGIPVGTEITYEEAVKLIHPEDVDYVRNAWNYAVKNKGFYIEHRLIINGNIKWVRQKADLEFNNEGKAVRGIGFTQDITSQKITENELLIAKEKAEESDRLKSAFLANMSHEIRTPMNGILGFTSLLKTQDLNGEKHSRYIDIIQKSGERMLNTVNDIIEISRIETNQISVNISNVNVNNIIVGLIDFFIPEAGKKGINILCDNKIDKSDFKIETDENKLTSVLTNLIKNAIKYTKKGVIEISCVREEDKLHFSVKDTGIGIPASRQKAVFDRFVQADIEDKQAHEGSGLGLTITKSYVEMLGGEIWVESTPDKGSTFHFTVDFVKANVQSEEIMEMDIDLKNSKKMNILVAEDDDVSYDLLNMILSSENCILYRALNGKESLNIFKENQDIDLILMDLRMPVMDGIQATKEIRKLNTNIPIIAQTAHALHGDKEKITKAGCTDYLSKPIIRDELINTIDKYR